MAGKFDYKFDTTDTDNPDSLEGVVKYFHRIIESMPNNVYWSNRECITMGCNKNTLDLLGLDRVEDFVGITYEEMAELGNWNENQAESFKKDDMEVMSSGKPKLNVEEPPLYYKNGLPLYYLTSRVPIFDDLNNVIGVVGISVDITERKRMEEALRKANEVKSEFIANMSHDLRTPMTGVMGMLSELSYLESDLKDALSSKPDAVDEIDNLLKTTSQNVSIAKNSATELLNMFNEILEAIKLDSGRVDAKEEGFNIRSVIERQVNLLMATARDKELDLSFYVDPSVPCTLIGLKRLLDRILVNLISNALKFTDKGSVVVSVSSSDICEQGDFINLIISVKDTGFGIPEDKFEEIFENFSRLTSSYRGVYKGTGLGLYAVKRYVESMSGDISVSSKEGEGSTFTVTLPLSVSEEKIEHTPDNDQGEVPLVLPKPKSSFSSTATSNEKETEKCILITEDNVAAAVAVKGMLIRLGFHVDHAKTGRESIDMASKNDYKLILMDIGLPDITGIDVAVAIRKLGDKKKASTPIVALTGHVDKRGVCLGVGMQDLLNKPTKSDDLKRVLDEYVSPSEGAAPAVVDWDQSISMLGDEEAARAIIKTCAKDLKERKHELINAFKDKNNHKLRDLLHYMKGGVCYIKAPALVQSIQAFHDSVKETPQSPAKMLKSYQHLLNEIDVFVKEVNSL